MTKADAFIPYFKIKWARYSSWTLLQAAYLSTGADPSTGKERISYDATNIVSKRYHWLLNKAKKGFLYALCDIDGQAYFNTGSLYRLLSEKFDVDGELLEAMDCMNGDEVESKSNNKIVSSIYREAGRLVYDMYPLATRAQVANFLLDLPAYYNSSDKGVIPSRQAHQIDAWLKSLGKLSGKPKAEDKQEIEMCKKQLIEMM